MAQGIDIGPKKRSGKTFEEVFYGLDAVSWLLSDAGPSLDDKAAVELAQSLMDCGFISRVSANIQMHDTLLKHKDLSRYKAFENNDTIYRVEKKLTSPWRLHVQLHKCEHLPNHSLLRKISNQASDPYVKLTVGGETLCSKVVIRNLDPNFNEYFTFGIDNPQASQLRLNVFDYDSLSSDELLSSALLPLHSLAVLDPTEGLVDQLQAATPLTVKLRRCLHTTVADAEEQGTATLSLWLTKHVAPPNHNSGGSPFVNCTLKAMIFETRNVSDGHLASIDMKIGSAMALRWVNVVSIGVGKGSDAIAYTSASRKIIVKKDANVASRRTSPSVAAAAEQQQQQQQQQRVGSAAPSPETTPRMSRTMTASPVTTSEQQQGSAFFNAADAKHDAASGAHAAPPSNFTPFNELISFDVKLNPLVDDVRIIVHQKAKSDINLRAVCAATIPTRDLPIVDPALGEVHVPRPVGLSDTTLFHLPEADETRGSETSSEKGPPAAAFAASTSSGVLPEKRNPVEPLVRWVSMSSLAMVGSNRVISNGEVLVAMWLEEAAKSEETTSLLGEEVTERSEEEGRQDAPIEFPAPLEVQIVDTLVPAGFRRVRKAILTNSEFGKAYYASLNDTSLEIGDWGVVGGGGDDNKFCSTIGDPTYDGPFPVGTSVQRVIKYIMPKSALVSASGVVCRQTLTMFSSRAFVVFSRTSTPEVPFGKTFETVVQMIFECRAGNTTWVSLSSEVQFIGSKPFVYAQIERGAKSGTTEAMNALANLLKDEAVGHAKGGKKKAKKKDYDPHGAGTNYMLRLWIVKILKWVIIVSGSLYLGWGAGHFSKNNGFTIFLLFKRYVLHQVETKSGGDVLGGQTEELVREDL